MVSTEHINALWLKVAAGLLVAGVLYLIPLTYSTHTQISVVQTDISHVMKLMQGFDTRLTKVENSRFTGEDAEQMRAWVDLKLESVKLRLLQLEKENSNRKTKSYAE